MKTILLLKLLLVPAVVTALIGGYTYIQHLQAQRDAALIERNDALASLDTLKTLKTTDSLVIVGKLATYTSTIGDLRGQLDSARGKIATLTRLLLRPASVDTVHVNPITDSTLLVYTDSVVGPPTDVKATVTIAPAPVSTTTWQWRIVPAAFAITVDVGCQARFQPNVLVGTPPWVTVSNVETRLARDLCGAPATTHVGRTLWRTITHAVVFAGGVWLGTRLH